MVAAVGTCDRASRFSIRSWTFSVLFPTLQPVQLSSCTEATSRGSSLFLSEFLSLARSQYVVKWLCTGLRSFFLFKNSPQKFQNKNRPTA